MLTRCRHGNCTKYRYALSIFLKGCSQLPTSNRCSRFEMWNVRFNTIQGVSSVFA